MNMGMFVRAPGNYDMDAVSRETGLECLDESLAVQSERDESDINTIVRRFGLTGHLPTGVVVPTYGDFSAAIDFREANDLIIQANAAFMEMPADVRSRFQNDPGAFLDFVNDASNYDEALKMGIVNPRKKEDTIPALDVPGKEIKDVKRNVAKGSGGGTSSAVGATEVSRGDSEES